MSSALRAEIEPEDLAQEILLGVHGRLDEFDGDSAAVFYGWVFRIAENRIRDSVDHFAALRRRRPDARRADARPGDVTTPSVAAYRAEIVTRVRDAVSLLPEAHRDVVRMHLLEGREIAEIAAATGRTPSGVRVLYCRALRALREKVPELA